ncbi:MAG: hypothetical protein M1829_002350 [Trizodia sp. TS-e1964]|nr:MAG: hypothetical protein M1829_002350 [Trizodia sp. TS-e1964]
MHTVKPFLATGIMLVLSLLASVSPTTAAHLAARSPPPNYGDSRNPLDPNYFAGLAESKVNTELTSQDEIYRIILLMSQAETKCREHGLFGSGLGTGKPQLVFTYSEGSREEGSLVEGFIVVPVTMHNMWPTLQELLGYQVKKFVPRPIHEDVIVASAVNLSVEELLSSVAWHDIKVLGLLRNIRDFIDSSVEAQIELSINKRWYQGVYRALLESDKLIAFKPINYG